MSRKVSWCLVLICLIPPLFAYSANMADHQAQLAAYGFIKCGFNQSNNALLACLATGLFSAAASGCSIVSLRAVPRPRPKLRIVETVTISVPFVVVVLLVALSFLG
jgi:hypothetical protein